MEKVAKFTVEVQLTKADQGLGTRVEYHDLPRGLHGAQRSGSPGMLCWRTQQTSEVSGREARICEGLFHCRGARTSTKLLPQSYYPIKLLRAYTNTL